MSPAGPVGPYTPVVRAGGWLVVSGQLGLKDGQMVDGGAGEQLAQAVANLGALLEGEGAALHEAYVAAFGGHRPARSAVAVAGLPMGAAVEIEAWAWVG